MDHNGLAGRNGQGKTNLLEAISMLGYGMSFCTARMRDCIEQGEKEAIVEERIELG